MHVFLYVGLISCSSLLEELATQEISIFTGHFLSYRAVKHLFPDPLQWVLSSCSGVGREVWGGFLCLFFFHLIPPSAACIINIHLSFHYDPGLGAACEMDVLFRHFLVTGVHPASFCFSWQSTLCSQMVWKMTHLAPCIIASFPSNLYSYWHYKNMNNLTNYFLQL